MGQKSGVARTMRRSAPPMILPLSPRMVDANGGAARQHHAKPLARSAHSSSSSERRSVRRSHSRGRCHHGRYNSSHGVSLQSSRSSNHQAGLLGFLRRSLSRRNLCRSVSAKCGTSGGLCQLLSCPLALHEVANMYVCGHAGSHSAPFSGRISIKSTSIITHIIARSKLYARVLYTP